MEPMIVNTESIKGDLPRREGWTKRESSTDIPFDRPIFSRSATLCDLAKDFTFFVHSTLFVFGNWTRDPVSDYVTVEDSSCEPFWVTFDKPIFSGLQFKTGRQRINRDWNYRLMGCPSDTWPGLLSYLQTLSGVNYQERRFHTVVVQKIPMVDYFALAKKSTLPKPLPMIDLYTVGLLGNDRNVYFEPASNPPLDRVRIKTGSPLPQIVAQAEDVLTGDFKPLSSPIFIPLEKKDDDKQPEVLADTCS